MGLVEKEYMWKWNSGICNAMTWVGQQEDSEYLIVVELVWYTGGYAYLDKDIPVDFLWTRYNPEYFFNSSEYLELYTQEGVYIIVRTTDLSRMKLLFFDLHEFLTEKGLGIVANIAGYPNAYVYKTQFAG